MNRSNFVIICVFVFWKKQKKCFQDIITIIIIIPPQKMKANWKSYRLSVYIYVCIIIMIIILKVAIAIVIIIVLVIATLIIILTIIINNNNSYISWAWVMVENYKPWNQQNPCRTGRFLQGPRPDPQRQESPSFISTWPPSQSVKA